VSPREPDRIVEILRRRWYLLPDLGADPTFAVDSNTCRT
jgi:hypothetical protein